MELAKTEAREEKNLMQVEMPNVTELTVDEAKKVLKELNLEVEISGEVSQESKVYDQLPKQGIKITEGTKVTIYIK